MPEVSNLYTYLKNNGGIGPQTTEQAFAEKMQDKGSRESLFQYMKRNGMIGDQTDFESFDNRLGARNRTVTEKIGDFTGSAVQTLEKTAQDAGKITGNLMSDAGNALSSAADFIMHPKGIQRRDLGDDVRSVEQAVSKAGTAVRKALTPKQSWKLRRIGADMQAAKEFVAPEGGYDNPFVAAGKGVLNAGASIDQLEKEGATALADIFQNAADMHPVGSYDKQAMQSVADKFRNYQVPMAATPVKANVKPGSLADLSYQTTDQLAGRVAPAVIVGLITKNPATATTIMAGEGGLDAYQKAKNLGATPDKAAPYAITSALIQKGIYSIPVGYLLKPEYGFFQRVAGSAVAGGISSYLGTGLQMALDKGTVRPDMTFGEAVDAMNQSGASGALLGGLMGAVSHPFVYRKDTIIPNESPESGASQKLLTGEAAPSPKQLPEGSPVLPESGSMPSAPQGPTPEQTIIPQAPQPPQGGIPYQPQAAPTVKGMGQLVNEKLQARRAAATVSNFPQVQQYYSYMTQEIGIAPIKAAGILGGGILPESSGNPAAINKSSGASGLFQHLGSRKKAMVNAVPDWATNPFGQINFAITEPQMKKYLAGEYHTVDEAVQAFTKIFEIPHTDKGALEKEAQRRASAFTGESTAVAYLPAAAEEPVQDDNADNDQEPVDEAVAQEEPAAQDGQVAQAPAKPTAMQELENSTMVPENSPRTPQTLPKNSPSENPATKPQEEVPDAGKVIDQQNANTSAATAEAPEWWNKITDAERYNRLLAIGHRPSTIKRETWFSLTDKQREALDYQWGNSGKQEIQQQDAPSRQRQKPEIVTGFIPSVAGKTLEKLKKEGKIPVKGVRIGDWIYHNDLSDDGMLAVSHFDSGLKALTVVSKAEAEKLIEFLNKNERKYRPNDPHATPEEKDKLAFQHAVSPHFKAFKAWEKEQREIKEQRKEEAAIKRSKDKAQELETVRAEATVESIAKEYAKELGHSVRPFHTEIAKEIMTGGTEKLIELLEPSLSSNKTTRKIFEKYTGIRLPGTKEARREAIESWGRKKNAELSGKKEAPEKPKSEQSKPENNSFREMAEREHSAANRFIDGVMEQFGLDRETASDALNHLIKVKLVKLDPVMGQFQLKDGRVWEKDVLLRAADLWYGKKEPESTPVEEKRPAKQSDESQHSIESRLIARLIDGGFKSIADARRWYKDEAGMDIEPGTGTAKYFDELVEVAAVKAARKIVEQSKSFDDIYSKLVELYEGQPRLGVRTSTSVAQQAYSTPAPLAYVASRLAGIGGLTKVYEPTAGNGVLLIEASPKNAIVNELNPDRAEALKEQGFTVTEHDASQYAPVKQVDVVIANPPFGVVKDERGRSKEFKVSDVYSTKEIDHAIALKALDSMSDDGKAVLILGAVKAESEEALSDGYNGKAKREFYLWLHQHYNVVDHFIVSGDLYQKQGAGWPVDVITIHGRGKSALKVPAANVPDIVNDWKSLKERVKDYVATGDTVGTTVERIRRGRDTGDNAGAEKPAGNVRTGVTSEGTGQRGRPGGAVERGTAGENDRSNERSVDAVEPAQKAGRKEAEPAAKGGKDVRRSSGGSRAIKEGKSQTVYKPASKAKSVNTLLPVNMANGVEAALAKISTQKGDLDKWVADELGYKKNEIGNYLSAEQIDAAALAIHNIQKGAAFIIGDQTGIGKGRFVASIIRWSLRKGHVPVFITEKPDLYADMYRDLTDTGIKEMLGREPRILATNSGLNISLGDGDGAIKTAAGKAHDQELMKEWKGLNSSSGGSYDMVFTTYSQLQTVKGESTTRRGFLEAISPMAVFVVDESHNAGGNQKIGFNGEKVVDDVPDRAQLVRNLTRQSIGTVFSSATYAKRPEVMDLYASTDLGLAVDDIEKLPEVIGRGGVPMQQIIASMLAESGQYLRRERSFDGIDYDVVKIPVDRGQYDTVANIMGWINAFSQQVALAAKGISKELKAEGRAMSGSQSTGGAGVDSTNFTSVMHNVIGQMLFALKADAAADMAISDLKAGMKPVITVAGTLESFHKEIVDSLDLKDGDKVDIGFGDLLLRYLEKCRWVTERRPFMKKGDVAEKKRLTDQQLGPTAVSLEKKIMQIVQTSNFSNMPISPIDWIRHRITDAGYKVTEITGRQSIMLYDKEKNAYLGKRPLSERGVKGKERTKAGFNNGDIDAVILNQSGSTGISLHASETFKDQRKRMMTIAQAEGNIDTHMQMLGRVNRTGQVVLPGFRQLNADIPAENRPAAVLAKKMASLNANTTGSTKSRFTSDDVPDIINVYGDEAAYELLLENPKLLTKLGSDLLKVDEDSDRPVMADIARRMTGRIPMLPLKEQEEVYEQLIEKFNSILQEANARGENALEAQTMKLDAETLDTKQIQAQTGDSPFQGAVHLEKLRVNNLNKPFTSEEVLKQVEDATGVKEEGEPWEALEKMRKDAPKEFIRENLEAFKAYRIEELQDIETPEARDKAMDRLNSVQRRWMQIVTSHGVGSPVELLDGSGFLYRGIVTEIKQTGKPTNPLALSTWKMKVAVASSTRQLTIPFSKLFRPGTTLDDNSFSIREVGLVDGLHVIDMFDVLKNTDKETRYMVTGNIPAGYGIVGQGAIVNYTTADGDVKQGILMKRGYKFEASNDVAFLTGDQVVEYLNAGGVMRSSDDAIKAIKNGAMVRIEIKGSKQAGGKYFLDRALIDITGDFVSVGGMMRAEVSETAAAKAFDRMRSLGAKLRPDGKVDIARKIVGGGDQPKENDNDVHARRTAPNRAAGYRPLWRERGMPDRPESDEIKIGGRAIKLKPEDEPTRVESIRKQVEVIIGRALYRGKIKGRTRAGFYRQSNGELRVRNLSDVEVLAHEMAHYLGLYRKKSGNEFNKLYTSNRFRREVQNLSYTDNPKESLDEGFAEYVRLWLTQHDEAKSAAPEFTAAFENLLAKDKELSHRMRWLQDDMHRWYYQGDAARLRAKSSGNQYSVKERLQSWWADRPASLLRQQIIDSHHAAKVMERELTGRIADAEKSPVKQLDLLNGVEGIIRESFIHGAPAFNKKGEIVFNGPSMMQVWSESLKKGRKIVSYQEDYFVARRAEELTLQGRENLISKGEIKAGLAYEKKFLWFAKAFEDYQKYRVNMVHFLVDCGYVEPDVALRWIKVNQNYVPFNREAEGIGRAMAAGAGNTKRLKGGTANIKHIYDNMILGDARMIAEALKTRALRDLYVSALKSEDGAKFIARLAPDSDLVRVTIEQQAKAVAEAMAKLGLTLSKDGLIISGDPDAEKITDIGDIEHVLLKNPELMQFWTFGHKPRTVGSRVESFIDPGTGKRVWFEISGDNELLVNMLDSLAGAKMPEGPLKWLLRAAYTLKNIQTLTITQAWNFAGGNIVRDTQEAFARSGGQFRPIIDNLIGMKHILHDLIKQEGLYHEMKAQGGGWAGAIRSQMTDVLETEKGDIMTPTPTGASRLNPVRLFNEALEVLMWTSEFFEMSTRVGYYARLRELGVGAREAAWQSRQLTTDFRTHGSDPIWTLYQRTIPFFSAYIQATDRDLRAFLEVNGEMKFRNLNRTEWGTKIIGRNGGDNGSVPPGGPGSGGASEPGESGGRNDPRTKAGRSRLKSRKVRMYLATGALVALNIMNALKNEDDDRYKELTPDQKARFLHFFTADQHFTIPKTHGIVSMLMAAGQAVVDHIKGEDITDTWKFLAFAVAYELSADLIPGALHPVYDLAVNKSFTGAPIIARHLENVEPRYQFTDRTPQLYVQLGKKLGVSPDAAHYLVKGYTGYLSDFIDEVSERILWDKEKWGERPFANGPLEFMDKPFVQRQVPFRTKWTDDYYDLKKRAAEVKATVGYLMHEPEIKSKGIAKDYLTKANQTLYGIDQLFAQIDQAFKDQDDFIASVKYNPSLSAKEKERKINHYYEMKNESLGRTYQQIKAAVDRSEADIKK